MHAPLHTSLNDSNFHDFVIRIEIRIGCAVHLKNCVEDIRLKYFSVLFHQLGSNSMQSRRVYCSDLQENQDTIDFEQKKIKIYQYWESQLRPNRPNSRRFRLCRTSRSFRVSKIEDCNTNRLIYENQCGIF